MQLPQNQQQHQSPTQWQQRQTSDPYHSFNPQEHSPNEGSASPTMHLVQQQQQPSPVIFWSQSQGDATGQAHIEPYIYLPPSVGTPQQTDTGINTSYSQPVGATTPPALYIPVSQIPTTSIARQQDVQ